MKKTFKVVMIPCEDKQGSLHISNGDQHLYIVSDDEIKEGDPHINEDPILGTTFREFTVYKAASKVKLNFIRTMQSNDSQMKFYKTIASTDKTITPSSWIPESFIKAYIKAYKEGKVITEIQLELVQDKLYIKIEDLSQYESKPKEFQHPHTSDPNDIWKVKTREDNTVIIHQSKTYSREEVELLIEFAWASCSATTYGEGEDVGADCRSWINTHLT